MNPKDAPKGYVAVFRGGKAGCLTCAFIRGYKCFSDDFIKCLPTQREDGCNVIFKRGRPVKSKEKKAK